jgi:hypothetical protein
MALWTTKIECVYIKTGEKRLKKMLLDGEEPRNFSSNEKKKSERIIYLHNKKTFDYFENLLKG